MEEVWGCGSLLDGLRIVIRTAGSSGIADFIKVGGAVMM